MSESRRKVLAAGAAALPDLALGGLTAADEVCERPARERGPNSEYFPNVVLTTHEHRRVLFYDDLLAGGKTVGGKTVLIHCMSIANDAVYPVVSNLARVQPYLGERLGRDVFLYSLSVDPADTPEALADFAHAHGARPGWLFLAGDAADVDLLRGKLYAHNGPHRHGSKDCSVGLARYGNESIGLWGACPSKANPEWIARRLSWVAPAPQPAAPQPAAPQHAAPRRRGPHPHTYWS